MIKRLYFCVYSLLEISVSSNFDSFVAFFRHLLKSAANESDAAASNNYELRSSCYGIYREQCLKNFLYLLQRPIKISGVTQVQNWAKIIIGTNFRPVREYNSYIIMIKNYSQAHPFIPNNLHFNACTFRLLCVTITISPGHLIHANLKMSIRSRVFSKCMSPPNYFNFTRMCFWRKTIL